MNNKQATMRETEFIKCLFEHSVGVEVMQYIEALPSETIVNRMDVEMVRLFSDIVKILDDDSLDDPTCFYRIDAIVRVFQEKGFGISRHDW